MSQTFCGKSWEKWIEEYGWSHQHPVNRLCHSVGIPLIASSIVLALIGFVVHALWFPAVVMFVAGWFLQFVGHAFERKLPEFFRDWRFLFVGLRWWFSKVRGRQLIIAAVLLLGTTSGCVNSSREAEAIRQFAEMERNGIAQVKVDERGDTYLNKELISLEALGAEFDRINKLNGVVWYYRISESQPAEASGSAVLSKVIEYKLPVKMCASDDPCRKAFE